MELPPAEEEDEGSPLSLQQKKHIDPARAQTQPDPGVAWKKATASSPASSPSPLRRTVLSPTEKTAERDSSRGGGASDGEDPQTLRSSSAAHSSSTTPSATHATASMSRNPNPLQTSQPRRPDKASSKVSRAEESSPDESTAIVWRERGGGRRNYGGGASREDNDSRPSDATQVDHHDGEDDDGTQNRHVPETSAAAVAAAAAETQDRWWKRVAEKYGSIELDNKASVARDHLALERTFLAWLRTSLAFASIGIAVTQLFRLNTSITSRDPAGSSGHLRQVGKPLGATFLAISMVVLFVGFHRYFESQHWIIRGKFPASRGSIFVISFIAAALIVVSLVVVVTVDTNVYEK